MQLKALFETCFILQFTYETEVNKQIPSFTTLIERNRDNVDSRIYTKSTNSGECMNCSSHCPDASKISSIDHIKFFLHGKSSSMISTAYASYLLTTTFLILSLKEP